MASRDHTPVELEELRPLGDEYQRVGALHRVQGLSA